MSLEFIYEMFGAPPKDDSEEVEIPDDAIEDLEVEDLPDDDDSDDDSVVPSDDVVESEEKQF